jgi:hypothetical protein
MKIPSLKNLLSFKRTQSLPVNRSEINVHRDWKIIMGFTFLIILLLIIWSLYLLDNIRRDDFLKAPIVEPVTKSAINEKKLEAVSNIFLEKSKNHEILKTTSLPVSDPSR